MSPPWPQVRLGDVVQHRKHFVRIDDLAEYKRCRVQLHAQGIVLRDRVPGAEIKTKAQQVCRTGDFLVAEIDAKMGGFGIVPQPLDGAIVSSHYFLFEINDRKLDREFLDWYCKTPAFREQVNAQGTTNYAAIRPAHVLGYTIPLPPLTEQRRIVELLNTAMRHVDSALRLAQFSDAAAMTLGRGLRERAYQAAMQAWPCVILESVCASITDGDHNTPRFDSEGIPFIFVGNVASGRLHFQGAKRVAPDYFAALKESRVPRVGDLLLSAVGATLGIPAIVDTDQPFCFQRHIAILKPDRSQVDSRYLWHMLGSQTAFKAAWAATTGSAQPTVPLRAIRLLRVPLPPRSQQEVIAANLDRLTASTEKLLALQSSRRKYLDALGSAVLHSGFA